MYILHPVTESGCLLVWYVPLLHSIPYFHENTAYGAQNHQKNTVPTVFSPYAQALSGQLPPRLAHTHEPAGYLATNLFWNLLPVCGTSDVGGDVLLSVSMRVGHCFPVCDCAPSGSLLASCSCCDCSWLLFNVCALFGALFPFCFAWASGLYLSVGWL